MIEPRENVYDPSIIEPPVFTWMTDEQREEFEEWFEKYTENWEAIVSRHETDLSDARAKARYDIEQLKEQIDFFERHLHMMPHPTYEAASMHIKKLNDEIEQLKQDNRDLIEQNKLMFDTSMANDHSFAGSLECANEILKLKAQVKLLNTALDIAAEDIDFDVLGTCPNEFEDYGCPLGECKFADGKPHNNDCWKKAFLKAAEKHLRGNQ